MSRREHICRVHDQRKDATRFVAHQAIDEMLRNQIPVTFAAVSRRSGLSVGTLYRHLDVKIRISEEREAYRKLSPRRAALGGQGKRAELLFEVARLREALADLEEDMNHLYEIHSEPCWEYC